MSRCVSRKGWTREERARIFPFPFEMMHCMSCMIRSNPCKFVSPVTMHSPNPNAYDGDYLDLDFQTPHFPYSHSEQKHYLAVLGTRRHAKTAVASAK
jgi:hypothetical protein